MGSLILFSGGKESIYNLYNTKDAKCLLIFNYGQASFKREKESAIYYALKFGIVWVEKDIRGVLDIPPAIRFGGKGDINVSMRNTLFISIAVNYAKATGLTNVVVGVVKSLNKYVNDGFNAYLKDISSIVKHTENITLDSPSSKKFSWQIHKFLVEKADVSYLWLCQEGKGHYRNCGKCEKCITFIEESKDNKFSTKLKDILYGFH